jgi:phosphoribosylanthranilate isomerase
MIVQIYEIQTPEEAERCRSLGVDHIGSVLVSAREWRQPSIRDLIRQTRGSSSKNSLIPLFSEEDTLYKSVDYYQPDYIHFCDSLTDERGRARDLGPVIEKQFRFRQKFPEIGIIRTLPVPGADKAPGFPLLEIAAALEKTSDLFLADTWLGREAVEGYVGITGRPVDWEQAEKVVRQSRIPVILAGGLSPENAYDAVVSVRPAGADSCTQTNALDPTGKPVRFRKDFTKVAAFVAEVRRAEKDLKRPIDSKS